jgi:hypothetical protein
LHSADNSSLKLNKDTACNGFYQLPIVSNTLIEPSENLAKGEFREKKKFNNNRNNADSRLYNVPSFFSDDSLKTSIQEKSDNFVMNSLFLNKLLDRLVLVYSKFSDSGYNRHIQFENSIQDAIDCLEEVLSNNSSFSNENSNDQEDLSTINYSQYEENFIKGSNYDVNDILEPSDLSNLNNFNI